MNIIVLLLGLLSAFGPLSIDMYLPAFPLIAKEFGVNMNEVQLSLSAYLIGIAIGQIFYGPLTDRYGRKKPLYTGLFIYCISSLLCATSNDVTHLITYRFFQAVGSCAGMVISRAVVRDLYKPQDAARVFSLLMLIMGVAPILAPVLGGFLSDTSGWRSIFWVLCSISALTFLLMFFLLKETHQEVIPLSPQNMLRNYSQIIRDRSFLSNALGLAFTNAGMFSYITGSSFVFVKHFGVSPTTYGWIFGMNAFGIIGCSQINGILLSKFNADKILKSVLLYGVLAAGLLSLLSVINPPMILICLGLFLYLPIMGIVGPNASAMALSHQKKLAGSASALLGTIQFSISGLMSALVSTFHDGTIRPICFIIFICAFMAYACHHFVGHKASTKTLSTAS